MLSISFQFTQVLYYSVYKIEPLNLYCQLLFNTADIIPKMVRSAKSGIFMKKIYNFALPIGRLYCAFWNRIVINFIKGVVMDRKISMSVFITLFDQIFSRRWYVLKPIGSPAG